MFFSCRSKQLARFIPRRIQFLKERRHLCRDALSAVIVWGTIWDNFCCMRTSSGENLITANPLLEPLLISHLPLAIAAFCIGLSKGGLPGVGMIAVPLMALTMSPIKAAALVLPIFILSDIVAVYLYRHNFDRANLRILIPACLLGVGLGWLTASTVSDDWVALMIGLLGVGFCLNVWLRPYKDQSGKPPRRVSGLFWGTLSGFTSFVAHAGAPPYQIYTLPQKMPRLVFAGTTTILFASVNLAKIVPYAMIEPFTTDMIKTSLIFLPVALAGTLFGKLGVQKLSDRWFYRLVQIALFLICIELIVKSTPALISA